MQKTFAKAWPANSVRAMFEDGMSTFLLTYDATFEELADRLGHLAEQHQGRPIAIDVKLGARDERTLPTEMLVYPAPRRNAPADRARQIRDRVAVAQWAASLELGERP